MGTGIQQVVTPNVESSPPAMRLDAQPSYPQVTEPESQARHWLPLFWTFLTTLSTFAIFLVQGVMIARILGPTGRGEFGSAIYFPRDLLLYVGLLGSIELVTSYAAQGKTDLNRLRVSAVRLGFLTGVLTALFSALLAILLLIPIQKAYLIPYALVCCAFLPFEHLQLVVSSVDRGEGNFARYNWHRLLFAATFPVLVGLAWLTQLNQVLQIHWLWLTCLLFVASKIIGVLPTLWPVWRSWQVTSLGRPGDAGRPQAVTSEPSVWQLLREGRPYAISMLATELFERLDVLLIVALASVTESGYYWVAVPAASLLIVAPNALGIFTFNVGANRQARVTIRQAVKWMALTAAFQLFAALAFAAIIGYLIVAVYGTDYEPAIVFALWLIPVGAIKGFLQAADSYLKGRGKPLIGVWARTVSMVVMLAVVAATFSSLGLISVPMAACVGQVISLLVIIVAILLDVHANNQPRALPISLMKQGEEE